MPFYESQAHSKLLVSLPFLSFFNQCRKEGILMKNRILRITIPVVAIAALLIAALAHFGLTTNSGQAKAQGSPSMSQIQRRLLDGLASSELDPKSAPAAK